ncbi:cephalosporin-C deacetylase [Haloactinopolyspora alba]|uniref:Cephalosporin-C deacetylase n=1 Tax=Haloactinopolyspora alba TaxID=648780 RepID=A0A2P8DZ07_9ACTN|nr:acetylxylan esterase [Haloactinopolyspora alba]PSL02454.1 cephalosporin-C deacetylase [Haloactinopolyspora alba]
MPPAPYDEWFGPDAFDATYGYDEEQLRLAGFPAEPNGFVDFWTGLYARALRVDPEPSLRRVDGPPGVDLFELEFTSLDGVRLGGWFASPSDGRVNGAVVVGHGYGGRDAPDLGLVPDGAAAVFPVARGLPTRSLLDGVPSVGVEHVLHGIDAVETYIHGGCVADVWCAASVLSAVLPAPPPWLGYVGGSFGGGIGALALPWDARFDAGVLYVPSFGNHDLRLTMPCTGSGEAVRRHVAEHPEALDVLRYFDAATAAARLRIPMLTVPALWDPAVPPPGQFAVRNAMAGPAELVTVSAAHVDFPGADAEYERMAAAAREFLQRRTAPLLKA